MSAHPGLVMVCDASEGCAREPRRAPRLNIPSKWTGAPLAPVRIITPLHYCDSHIHQFRPADYLTDAQKARIEKHAAAVTNGAFRPDFERAFCDYLLLTTPEYRRFLDHIGKLIYVPDR